VADLVLRVFAVIGVLSTLTFSGFAAWILLGWREDHRKSQQADFAKWEAEMLSHSRRGMERLLADLHDVEGDDDDR